MLATHDTDLKKGSAELLILALVEAQPRHGYDLSQADRVALAGGGPLQGGLALPAALSPRGARVDPGPLGGEGGAAPAALLPPDRAGAEGARGAPARLRGVRGGRAARSWSQTVSECAAARLEGGDPQAPRRQRRSVPTRGEEIVDELAQHLDDRYDELVARRRDPSPPPSRPRSPSSRRATCARRQASAAAARAGAPANGARSSPRRRAAPGPAAATCASACARCARARASRPRPCSRWHWGSAPTPRSSAS